MAQAQADLVGCLAPAGHITHDKPVISGHPGLPSNSHRHHAGDLCPSTP